MGSSDFISKNLSEQDKICYYCRKKGHNKYNCKDRAAMYPNPFKANRKILDPKLIENPHLLNSIITGIPNREDLPNIQEIGKAFMSTIGIKWTEYEIDRPYLEVPERESEIRIQFQDLATKEKFIRHFRSWPVPTYQTFGCCYPSYIPHKFKFGKETFITNLRDDFSPEIDEVYTKLLKLKNEFDEIVIPWAQLEGVLRVEYKKDFWQVSTVKEVNKLRMTLNNLQKVPEQPHKPRDKYFRFDSSKKSKFIV